MLRTPLTTRRLAVLALVALLSAAPVAWAQCASSKADKAHCGAGKQMAETPAATDAKAMTPSPGEPAAAGTIAEVAASTGTFNTLLAAAEQARALEATLADGAEVVPTDPAVWREAMGGFWRTYADEVGGMERIRTIRETAGE